MSSNYKRVDPKMSLSFVSSDALTPFMSAIRAGWDDDSPRLVFADWLDEQHDPRGSMIRLSCELAHYHHHDPRSQQLRDELHAWQRTHLVDWLGELPHPFAKVIALHRGLLHVRLADLHHTDELQLDHLAPLIAAAEQGWVSHCVYAGYIERLHQFATVWPLASRLRSLSVRTVGRICDRMFGYFDQLRDLHTLDLQWSELHDEPHSLQSRLPYIKRLQLTSPRELARRVLVSLRRNWQGTSAEWALG